MLHYVDRLVINYVCKMFAAKQEAYSEFFF